MHKYFIMRDNGVELVRTLEKPFTVCVYDARAKEWFGVPWGSVAEQVQELPKSTLSAFASHYKTTIEKIVRAPVRINKFSDYKPSERLLAEDVKQLEGE